MGRLTQLFLVVLIGAQLPLFGVVRRLAIDIGSSSVKVLVADVDSDNHEIVDVLERTNIPLAISRDIQESGTGVITDTVRHRLIQLLTDVVKGAQEFEVEEYACVATQGFREARNSESIAQGVERQVGIQIHVIQAQEEALLGFQATAAITRIPQKRLVSWDLGGGSQEIVALSREGEIIFFTSPLGSLTFAAEVMLKIKRLNPGVVRSPNPMTAREIMNATQLARLGVSGVPDALRARVAWPDAVVVGIGSLAFLEVSGPGHRYSQDRLREAALALAGKSDAELGDPAYAPYAVTNLTLTLGTMQALGIQEIWVAQIDLTEGLVLNAGYNERLEIVAT